MLSIDDIKNILLDYKTSNVRCAAEAVYRAMMIDTYGCVGEWVKASERMPKDGEDIWLKDSDGGQERGVIKIDDERQILELHPKGGDHYVVLPFQELSDKKIEWLEAE